MSAMEKFAIGLDLGTSSVKAVLFSMETGVIAKESADFTYAPANLPDGLIRPKYPKNCYPKSTLGSSSLCLLRKTE